MKYKKHIFVCINERTDGRKSCGEATGMALVNAFKEKINKDRINAEVRAQKAGCFDICALGPAMVVYPEGIFYGNVTIDDVEEIYQSHIINNVPVERLKLKFDNKKE
jgi:(2Fe-2S) ferredoxin